jgi:hypothetical protein
MIPKSNSNTAAKGLVRLCPHCNKNIANMAVIKELSLVCPFCRRPCEGYLINYSL